MYGEQGRNKEALAASRQALDQARRSSRPDRLGSAHDQPRLHGALLQRMATTCGALGHYHDAYTTDAEALGIVRTLAASDRHERAGPAALLANTGVALKSLGRSEGALAHTAGAVEVHRHRDAAATPPRRPRRARPAGLILT
ncbi:hypothetical protein GCM10009557_76850 [Virgisporangium ochraceum]|uniref:Tetratricopeptide repeat protein n=1 Tax=Virgisporangium ochraceum TaxID=65505 RepID=A0A8J3ZZL3_9ACTN|nr:hypothetical protein [Virgisporangium ochraceum]GIJ71123.1 hypothetical protein Voc01_060400 [Virgisporangium ochraceum]